METKNKGKSLLKCIGILMIIFGGIATILYVMGMIGSGLLASVAVAEGSSAAVFGAAVIPLFFAFGLVWALLELFAGIAGVKHCTTPNKAPHCFKLGIAVAICSVLSSGWSIWVNGFSISAVISLLVGLILPLLYCYGAKLNQK